MSMNSQVRLGRVWGIPVGVNWSVVVIFASIAYLLASSVLPATVHASTRAYWTVAIIVAFLFFVALLAHELAHALLARHFGVQVKRITLWMLGGVTELVGEPATARQQLEVSAAGPLTSLAAGVVAGAAAYLTHVLGAPRLLVVGLVWLAGTNALLGVFNLLPGAPLDGGRVLQALLWMRWGDRARSEVAAARAGRVLGTVLMAVGVTVALFTTGFFDGIWLILVGWFVLSASAAEEETAGVNEAMAALTVADVMSSDPIRLPAYQTVDAVVDQLTATRQKTLPVIDFQGRLIGIVDIDTLVRLPASERQSRRVGDVVLPAERLPVATPDESVRDVQLQLARAPAVLVFAGSDFVGTVTADDITWAARRATLRSDAAVGR